MKHLPTSVGVLGMLMASSALNATPFSTCPSEAYLIQGQPASVHAVNLVTGTYSEVAADIGLSNSKFNAAGFNQTDGYLYGFDGAHGRLLRMGSDFQAEVLNVNNAPNYSLSSGDVYNDVIYFYRATEGIFKIDLSPLSTNPSANLTYQTIKSYSSTKASHFDIAIHPNTGLMYGIDNNTGVLYEYQLSNGSRTNRGHTGLGGDAFGALYFDGAGYLYAASNNTGKIFRVNLSTPGDFSDITGTYFATGPASGSNDGARCATAPAVATSSNIDFGDAPNSYDTLLGSNGPRHELDGTTWLGSVAPDGDPDGQADDNLVGDADEDGVGFVSALDPGLSSVITVNASTTGYLSAWFDWNRDGDFSDPGEQVFTDELLSTGTNVMPFVVSTAATAGASWSRFRFSQETGLSYNGGSTSGEVEDHPITITNNGYSIEYFPSANSFATVAFEDNWPYTVDYDMNDVIVKFRITEMLLASHVENIQITGELAAYGASYKNGFAIRLPGIDKSIIETELTTLSINGVEQATSGLEAISNEAIFIIDDNLSDFASSSCDYFRTESGCTDSIALNFTLNVYFTEDSDRSGLQTKPYDPFIFATPDEYHGEGITFQPGRKWEVHLPGQAPTEQFDTSLFGIGLDASNSGTNNYFKTATYLPWALLIVEDWKWPLERVDMVVAYPEFKTWAESGGVQSTNWHESPAPAKCYIP
ncbi:LruC domain-containing protein [Vibrio sagamiensis]|uniref:LruC domain-containing protein n=1 Tax=Vibrio sagamiensis NBRC 104589 TaxID=1219064 RepID=A0A511QJ11_9VIBR|nr:LruC domain-containing protein [Vibrio sagamiensis]PNQ57661.1 LruC domain-containing protein [Vibrio agarivorans]GEM77320.1 LruC domain-containing protein [Vibrio sagamiensis NBRC 104589]